MAYSAITLENSNTGQVKLGRVGFSWTVFFFGFFVPLIRGDWKWALIMFLVGSATLGLSNLVFMFMYNKLHIKDLVFSGFRATSLTAGNMDDISRKLGVNLTAGHVWKTPERHNIDEPLQPSATTARSLQQASGFEGKAERNPNFDPNAFAPQKAGTSVGDIDDVTFYGVILCCFAVVSFALYTIMV